MSRRSPVIRSRLLVDFRETEAHLNKLRLQHLKAERAKRADAVNTQRLVFRDRRIIQRLQEEREELISRQGVSQSDSKCWTDAAVVQDLSATLTCGEEELEAEKDRIASLKDQISKWERNLAGKKSVGGTPRHRSLLKHMCMKENKLDWDRKCLDKTMTRNGELREDLKTLQVEKKQFLCVQSCLEKELHAIRSDVSHLATKCSKTFSDSVKMKEQQRMEMDQDVKEVAQFTRKRSNVERQLSHFCRFEGFLEIKATERSSQDTDQDHRAVKPKQLESEELGLKDFKDSIRKILTETGESELDRLVQNFTQMEEQNYSLVKFVNHQHIRVEQIKRQIAQLCSAREMFKVEEEQQQLQVLQMNVSMKQEATERQLAAFQQRVDVIKKLLDQLKEGVESLLGISSGGSVICDRLGCSDENILESLMKVESRVNELLPLQNQREIDSLWLRPPAVSSAAATPAPVEEPDVVESLLMEAKEPVSRKDLLRLVDKRIQRKEKIDRPELQAGIKPEPLALH